jgi:dTDP-4-dehydrorhamnose 3,5-epimerase
MKFTPTALREVLLIEPQVFKDDRGFFFEAYQQRKFEAGGITARFVQDNHSRSAQSVLRGLHFQMNKPQGKLVRVVRGRVLDVAVDIRVGSPTFKKWVGVELSEDNFHLLYVPPGFAHGFATLSEVAEMEYKVTDFYDKNDEATLLWNDPDVAVSWNVASPLLSPKDQAGRLLKDLDAVLPRYKHGV